MKRLVLLALVGCLALMAVPARGITFGRFDGGRHPNVGALVAEFGEEGQPSMVCSGTLIAPDVFLTAAHCIAFLESIDIAPDDVWVTFDPVFDEDADLLPGTYFRDARFGTGGQSDTHDIAVVVLDRAVDIEPAKLPRAGLLNRISLRDKTFTAVGYGTVREEKGGGFAAILDNNKRMFVTQSFLSLQKAWLLLNMNPSTGSGGTCYGDSGGPHFLGGVRSNRIVSITITGDAVCTATDMTYRLDTASARSFLEEFVTLP